MKRITALIVALLMLLRAGSAPAMTNVMPAITSATTQLAGQGGPPIILFADERAIGGDTLSTVMLAALQTPYASGIKVDMCWATEQTDSSQSDASYHFTDSPTSTINQLAANLRPNQFIVIGLYAANCSPPWLLGLGVPMPAFFHGSLGGNLGGPCGKIVSPPMWDTTFQAQLFLAVRKMMSVLANTHLQADGSTLLSHVKAQVNGGMASSTDTESGVFSAGCKGSSTQQDVAAIWLGAPDANGVTWPALTSYDNYTPAKVRSAFAAVQAGLFAAVPSAKADMELITAVLATDAYGFPAISENGVIIQDNSTTPMPIMWNVIMDTAARTYGARVVFGWSELSLAAPGDKSPLAAQSVIEAGRFGASVEWELNGNATSPYSSGGVTSCKGRQDHTPATQACFAAIIAYGLTLVPQQSNGGVVAWIEVQPSDFIPALNMFWTGPPAVNA